jgi:hypothetical protein
VILGRQHRRGQGQFFSQFIEAVTGSLLASDDCFTIRSNSKVGNLILKGFYIAAFFLLVATLVVGAVLAKDGVQLVKPLSSINETRCNRLQGVELEQCSKQLEQKMKDAVDAAAPMVK